jgi:hypothetical protein
MIPKVEVEKVDGQTAVTKPSPEGILAIIAPSSSGTENAPVSVTRSELAESTFGFGFLPEFGSYYMDRVKKPVVLVKATASTEGEYGEVTTEGAPESTPSAITVHAATKPFDDYNVTFLFTKEGTIGVAGITFKYSLDGINYSATKALGTASTYEIEDTGVAIDFGAGDIAEGETVSFTTTGPRMTADDIGDALEALRTSTLSFEGVLIGTEADDTIVGAVDEWLEAIEGVGKFKHAYLNTGWLADSEDEEGFLADLVAEFQTTSIRLCLGIDGGDLVASRKRIRQRRFTALGVSIRTLARPIGEDPAYVAQGPVPGFRITDDNGGPKYHNEDSFPGPDDVKFTALRTIDGYTGTYVNNARVFSPEGSDYVFIQHLRTMNRACELAWQVLTGQLSIGVRKDKDAHIFEPDAQLLEGLVQDKLDDQLAKPGQVSGVSFTIARDDDLSSNEGAELTCTVAIASLAYVKKFKVRAGFVKSLG